MTEWRLKLLNLWLNFAAEYGGKWRKVAEFGGIWQKKLAEKCGKVRNVAARHLGGGPNFLRNTEIMLGDLGIRHAHFSER